MCSDVFGCIRMRLEARMRLEVFGGKWYILKEIVKMYLELLELLLELLLLLLLLLLLYVFIT